MRITVVLNDDGGTLKTADTPAIGGKMKSALEAAGHDVDLVVAKGGRISDELDAAAGSVDVDCVVVGGGDGSVSLAASLCWRHNKVLGVLPAGTMNLFARSLGMPLELDKAIAALATAKEKSVDIGTVNGRPFVHQVSIGIQPRMVEYRKSIPYHSRMGKIWASTKAATKVLIRPPSFRAEIHTSQMDESSRYAMLAISNNVYGNALLPFADRLDDGLLGIYSAPRLNLFGNMKFAAALMLGRWKDNEHFLSQSHDAITIKILSRIRGRKMSIDGELHPLPRMLEITLHARELRVLMPDQSKQ